MPDERSQRRLPAADTLEDVAAARQPTVTSVAAPFSSLRQRGEAVRALGDAFKLSSDALIAAETFEHLVATTFLPIESVANLSARSVRNWFGVLGADLSIDLSIEDLDPTFFKDPIQTELRAGRDTLGALKDFREAALSLAATQGESVSVTVRLRVGKVEALRQLERILAMRATDRIEGTTAPMVGVVFYSAEALCRFLALSAAKQWRDRGLGGEDRRVVVGLCDSVGYLAGPALEVIGATEPIPTGWLIISPQAWRRFGRRVGQARKLRDAESVWSGLKVDIMSDQLRVGARQAGLETVAARLAAFRVEVAACALASHIESADHETTTLRFAGPRPAILRLNLSAHAAQTHTLPGEADTMSADAEGKDDKDDAVDALVALAGWAYRDASPDRLAIAREALAAELPAAGKVTLGGLSAAAPQALATAHANLTLYLKGATERYFQVRRAAQEAITSYAESTRKAVSDLTSDVVDNAFKTVGLIVGVAIARLIQSSVSLPLAALGAALYSAYIIFSMWYLLRARFDRYTLERQALDAALDAMNELSNSERERLRAPALQADTHFERYYRLTWRIYATLAVLGGLLFALLFLPAVQALAPHVVAPTATPLRSS